MKGLWIFKSLCFVSVTLVLIYAEDYTVGEIETEKLFRQFYPGKFHSVESLRPILKIFSM